jgi:hypothetical protein
MRGVVNVVLLVFAMYCLRRARQAWAVYAPGPIEVLPLTDATTGQTVPPGELTTRFRSSLAGIGLSAPSPLPGGAPTVEFIQLLKQAPEEQKSLVATMGTLLGIADVRSAIVVSGVVRSRPGSKPLGLTVQVATLPSGGSVPVDVWDTTWDAVVHRAACEVAATLLTRTRQSRRPPWSTWRGLELDADLFQHYQDAQRFVAQRRYDEALGAYFAALDRDPGNLYIRLELAQLMESVGLYLDALLTYHDLVRLGARRDRRLLNWLTRRDDPQDTSTAPLPNGLPPFDKQVDGRSSRPPRRLALRSQQAAILVGRYRHALLLGFAEQLSEQWCKRPGKDQGERDRERARLRERLLGPLEFLYWDRHFFDLDEWGQRVSEDLDKTALLMSDGGQGRAPLEGSRAEKSHWFFWQIFVRWNEHDRSEEQWRLWQQEFFHWAAAHELRHLVRDYQWWRGRRIPGLPVSQTALHIAHVWAPVRREWTRALAGRERIWTVPGVPAWDDDEPRRPRLRWPPRPQEVDVALERLLRRRLSRWRDWQDHYNAACTFAVTVLPEEVSGTRCRFEKEDTFAKRRKKGLRRGAMQHLRRAIDSMDSAYLARKRDWIGGGDPDLIGLRATDDFRAFDGEYIPRLEPTPHRPTNAVPLRLTHYMCLLAVRAARARKEAWSLRGTIPGYWPDPDLRGSWWAEEVDAWHKALRLARDHRHWQTRLGVLRAIQDWAARRDESFQLPFPTYQDDPVIQYFANRADQPPNSAETVPADSEEALRRHREVRESVENRARVAVQLRDARFAELKSVIEGLGIDTATPPRLEKLRRVWALRQGESAFMFCRRWSGIWQAVESAFDQALRYEGDPTCPIDDPKQDWVGALTCIEDAFEPRPEDGRTPEVRANAAARALFAPLRVRLGLEQVAGPSVQDHHQGGEADRR